jgi:hypothetical protein
MNAKKLARAALFTAGAWAVAYAEISPSAVAGFAWWAFMALGLLAFFVAAELA